MPQECNHKWMVVSTCVTTVELIVQCTNCRSAGIVSDPTKKEWRKAWSAPSNPYRWENNDRVTLLRKEELEY